MIIPTLRSRCLFCDSVFKAPFDSTDRHCHKSGCASHHAIPPDKRRFYVSTVPDFTGRLPAPSLADKAFEQAYGEARPLGNDRPNPAQLPPLDGRFGIADMFATDSTPLAGDAAYSGWRIQRSYARDVLLHDHGLRCGNPRLLPIGNHLGFDVDLLDFSTYNISWTMKDPRSWAIINVALENGIRHLALWTAGNAGLSLARLAFMANHKLPRSQRIQVYCVVGEDLDPGIRLQLRHWQAQTIPHELSIGRGSPILSEEDIWNLVGTCGPNLPGPSERWNVTDGWDGAGIVEYRLVAMQVLNAAGPGQRKYDAVLVPVGSGDLFVGFYLATLDSFNAENAPKLIAAVPPDGQNVFTDPDARQETTLPVIAGKLEGDYTPLAKALQYLLQYGNILKIPVGEAEHRQAVARLARSEPCPFPFEPSAIMGYAALKELRNLNVEEKPQSRLGALNTGQKVLVVSTGSGLIPSKEAAWLRRNWTGQI